MRPVLQILGDDRTQKNLLALAGPAQERVKRSMLAQGLKPLAEAQRLAAPVGKTGAVRASIGSRILPVRRGGEAKAGINVGKKFPGKIVNRGPNFKHPSGFYAPHAHLVALGTGPRFTGRRTWAVKAGIRSRLTGTARSYRGRMPANPFIRRATASAEQAVIARMRWAAGPAIAREVKKLGLKTGAPVGGVS